MHNVLFSIGPFTLTLLGLFSALGMTAGLILVRRIAGQKAYDENQLLSIGLVAILSAIVGARLYYAIVFSPEYFLAHPMRIFAFHEGGLSIQGGLLGGIIGTVLYCRIRQYSFWQAADIFAPGIILGQAIGRIGCDVFGIPASRSFFWTVQVQGEYLHPVQIYESLLNYALFLLIWRLRDRTHRHGELFLIYAIGFAFNRFVVEFFRSNPQAYGQLTVAHAGSLVMAATALFIFLYRRKTTAAFSIVANKHTTRATSYGRDSILIALLASASVILYYLIHLVLLV
ncbi:prolipoprotein diacylglyceryl transferase [Spirochaeta dissipatitropha]